MRLYFLLIFILYGCENLIYDSYRIIKIPNISNENKKAYIVKRGDNLYSISRKFNISIQKLIIFNDISEPFRIFPGQRILIPKQKIHLVKKGETLYSISRKYNTDVYIISRLNKIKNINEINKDQRLIIPSEYTKKSFKKTKSRKNSKSKNKNKIKNKIINNNKKENPSLRPKKVSFIWPVKGEIVEKFGKSNPGFFNDGINISSNIGKSVKASLDGEVIYSGNEIPGYGNLILIKHSGNWVTAYAHLEKVYLQKGKRVKKGELIGTVGKTGNVKKPQLHFEIRKGKNAVNPLKLLS